MLSVFSNKFVSDPSKLVQTKISPVGGTGRAVHSLVRVRGAMASSEAVKCSLEAILEKVLIFRKTL